MRKILQMLIFLATSSLLAQFSQTANGPTKRILELENYMGSIYKNKEYIKADVIDEKTGTHNTRLKYNIFTDALEHKAGGEIKEIIKIPTISAKINDDHYYYCSFYNQQGRKKNGYYIIVESNELYRIYKKYALEIEEPKEKDAMTGSSTTSGKIKILTTYYLEEDGVVLELPMNKKDILATLSDKEEELKEYIKKEKIRIKKEEDLMRLVARYNALKSMDASQPQNLLSNTVQNN